MAKPLPWYLDQHPTWKGQQISQHTLVWKARKGKGDGKTFHCLLQSWKVFRHIKDHVTVGIEKSENFERKLGNSQLSFTLSFWIPSKTEWSFSISYYPLINQKKWDNLFHPFLRGEKSRVKNKESWGIYNFFSWSIWIPNKKKWVSSTQSYVLP